MDSARILIAMSSNLSNKKMETILVEAGFMVIDQAVEGHDCLRKIRNCIPDLAILELNLALMNGYEIAKVVLEDDICDIIIISSNEHDGMLGSLKKYNNFVSLTKPINKAVLLNTLELMTENRKRIKELKKEINELKYTLDTRKEVEKAKGLLMKHLGLPEEDAFKRIQKQSMDRGIPMKEIAKAIILTYEI